MNFNDINYERTDYNRVKDIYEKALTNIRSSKDFDEVKSTIESLNKTRVHLQTMKEVASIKYSINTKDDYFVGENQYWDEYGPLYQDLDYNLYQTLLSIGFKDQIIEEYGRQFYSLMECQVKSFSKDIIGLLQEENRLMSDYTALLASAKIDFAGRVCNLSDMNFYMESLDDRVREEAIRAHTGFFEENEAEFDSIYDELVKVRTKIAKKLGYKNFVQLAYDRLGRTEYNAEMVAKYRKQIYELVVPIAQSLKKRQSKRLKLDKVYYYDTGLKYLTGNAVPQGEPDWIVEQAKKMYNELSPETSEFFKMMTDYGLMDLLSTKGKAGGGYCTGFPLYKVPFIFANFNNTQHDVEVMTHEAGHAFQAYQSRNARLLEYVWPTYEACEIHSMSMEFFTWPWMNLFFEEQTDKFRFTHLSGALLFLPYGVTVDEFQHWVYEHPEASPAERKAAWRTIEKKYLPERNYDDNEFLNRGGYWMRQGHIFSTPFYYIDYTLAQVCALQFWTKSLSDRKTAWADYLRLCKAGGRDSFLRLVELANLKNPFKEGCIASVIPACTGWLNSINDTAF